jgi:hypothetical protein
VIEIHEDDGDQQVSSVQGISQSSVPLMHFIFNNHHIDTVPQHLQQIAIQIQDVIQNLSFNDNVELLNFISQSPNGELHVPDALSDESMSSTDVFLSTLSHFFCHGSQADNDGFIIPNLNNDSPTYDSGYFTPTAQNLFFEVIPEFYNQLCEIHDNTPGASSPAASSPAASSPAANSPAANSPAASDPTANDPTANDPTANSPTANSPTANSPTANDPTANSPAANDPTANSPAANSPAAIGGPPFQPIIDNMSADELEAVEFYNAVNAELSNTDMRLRSFLTFHGIRLNSFIAFVVSDIMRSRNNRNRRSRD